MDGAYFGTTFPHLLLMTYPSMRPAKQQEVYVPRVFGFKLHATNVAAQPAAIAAAAAAAGNSSTHATGVVRHVQVSLVSMRLLTSTSWQLDHESCEHL